MMRFAAALLLAGLASACGDETETAPVCGNGQVEAGEACDDGNTDDTDGCLSTCVAASCGDGFVHDGFEGCDDGNDDDSDACLSTCISATCGDGVIQADVEQCDDGAANSDTGACTTACIPARCGDGKVQDGVEQCDDGNDDDSDDCLSTCVAATCGDGVVQEGVEQCDDGNDDDADACLSTCVSATCGDGVVQAETEQCDDGAENSDAGSCTTTCRSATCGDGLIQDGVEACDLGAGNLEGAACLPGCIPATCGDGFIQTGVEECDDGDANSDTGACLQSCEIAGCGDGYIRDGVESCDDGNGDDTDDCPTNCEPARCGDGFVQAEVEGCDLGDATNSDDPGALCRTDCQPARCGDGIEDPNEGCDDGNTLNGDGCSATCVVEGDDCANPLVIAPSHTAFTVAGDTRQFGSGIDLDFCTTPTTTNRDVVYSFTSPIAARWDVELTPSEGFDIVLGVLHQCSAAPRAGDEIVCADDPAEGGTERLFFLAGAGETIYFVIDGFDDDIIQEGTFTLSGTATPVVGDGQACGTGVAECAAFLHCNINTAICGPNICGDGIAADAETCDDGNALAGDGCGSDCTLEGDQCSTAGILPIRQDGTVSISGTTVGLSADYQSGCATNGASGLNGDLFFAFTSPTDAHWKFDIAASFNSVLAIQTMCGNNQTNLACDNQMNSRGGDSVSATLGAGETVYILVDGYGNSTLNEGTFTLTGSSIPVVAVDAVCTDETPCAPGSFCYGLSGTCFNTCGDGVLDAGSRESCDDGNQVAGDGCGANCVREAAFACPTPGVACHPIVCGDGKVDAPESCDDGGMVDGDGCSATCQLEAHPLPGPGSNLVLQGRYTPSDPLWNHPNAVCGPYGTAQPPHPYDVYAFVNNEATPVTVDFEMSDFGRLSYMHTYALPWNPADPIGNCLTSSFQNQPAALGVTIGPGEMRVVVVSDFYDTFSPYALTVRNAPVCNDGIWGNAEQCDLGDLVDGDGCSASCAVESGFTCDRAAGTCFPSICGDGQAGNGEACDDGNTIDDDLCDNQCQLNGDDCGNAAGITADPVTNTFSIQSDTSTSDLAFDLRCNSTTANTAGSKDRVYEFTAPIDGVWTFTAIASPSFNLFLDIQRICGDSDRSLVCDGSSTTSSIRTGTIEMTAGETVFLVVDGYGFASTTTPQQGPFTLSGTVIPFVGAGSACDPAGETSLCAVGSFCDTTGPAPACVASACGNGVLESGEECEDGNSDPADGCDACRITAVPLAEAGSTVVFRGSVDASDPTWAPPGSTCNTLTRNGDWHYDTWYVRNTGTATRTVDIVTTAFPTTGALIVYDLPWDPTEPTFNCEKANLVAAPQIMKLEVRAGEARAIVVGTGSTTNPTPGPYELRITTDAVCGDGIWGDAEACDDGNHFDGDGCSATCTVEDGQTCSWTTQTCFANSCGDGLVGNGEACDDGNLVDDDSCANDCTQNGDTCLSVANLRVTAAQPSTRVTGSTTGLGSEYSAGCANTLSGDIFYEFTAPVHGIWEFSVRGDPNFDTAIAVTTVCGDPTTERDCAETGGKGAIDKVRAELEVGDTVFVVVDGYGTTSTRNEGTFTLDVGVTPIKQRNEPCDPAGVADACVTGTVCDEITLLCMGSVCGNGVIESGEECDDGNVANGDSCSATCEVAAHALAEAGSALRFEDGLTGTEATWSPPNGSCSFATRAGDWFYDAYVVRNTGATDKTVDITIPTMITTTLLFVYELPWDPAAPLAGCTNGSSSTAPSILDLVVPAGEARVVVVSTGTTGNRTPGTYLLNIATEAVCGDGIFGDNEACDDGALFDNDGCSQSCEVEPDFTCTPAAGCFQSVCGDGLVGNGEECDDGNLTDGDGCSSACTFQNTNCAAPGIIATTAADPSFTIRGSTAASANDFNVGCAVSLSSDAVYEFTAPVTGKWTFGARGQGFDAAIAVRTACLVSASELDCSEVGGNNALDEVVAELTAGQTVYVVVDGFSNATGTTTNQGPFTLTGRVRPTKAIGDACDPVGAANGCVAGTFCDGSAATPVCVGSVCGNGIVESGEQCDDNNVQNGDGCTADCRIEGATCAAPRVISLASDNTFSITGDTTGLDRHYTVGCAITDNSPEMHLQFTSPIAGRWTFAVLGDGFDSALAVTGTCGDPSAQIACAETGGTGSNAADYDTVEVDLDANQTVFIVVDGYSTATTVHEGFFTLTGKVTPIRQVDESCDPQAVADVCAFGSQCDLIGNTCVATMCGNGVLQPAGGEECDDGVNNGPNAACSNDCKIRGDDCSAPFDLRTANTSTTAGNLLIAGSTDGFTNKHTPACHSEMISTSTFRDVAYQLTGNGTTDEYWEITLAGGSTSDIILDIASDCVARNARIFCSPDVDNATSATATFHLGANETVFVWVDSEGSAVQNYTLTGTWQATQPLDGSCNPFGGFDGCAKGLVCDDTAQTCIATVCGDWRVTSDEECDEGPNGGNGCSADCYIEGDTCNAPYDLNVVGDVNASGAWRHAGDISTMKPDYIPFCETAAGYNDVVYVFTAPVAGTYTFAETEAFDAVLYASSVCPDTSGSPDLACTPNESLVLPLDTGEAIYLFVERTGSTTQGTPTSNTSYVFEASWAP